MLKVLSSTRSTSVLKTLMPSQRFLTSLPSISANHTLFHNTLNQPSISSHQSIQKSPFVASSQIRLFSSNSKFDPPSTTKSLLPNEHEDEEGEYEDEYESDDEEQEWASAQQLSMEALNSLAGIRQRSMRTSSSDVMRLHGMKLATIPSWVRSELSQISIPPVHQSHEQAYIQLLDEEKGQVVQGPYFFDPEDWRLMDMPEEVETDLAISVLSPPAPDMDDPATSKSTPPTPRPEFIRVAECLPFPDRESPFTDKRPSFLWIRAEDAAASSPQQRQYLWQLDRSFPPLFWIPLTADQIPAAVSEYAKQQSPEAAESDIPSFLKRASSKSPVGAKQEEEPEIDPETIELTEEEMVWARENFGRRADEPLSAEELKLTKAAKATAMQMEAEQKNSNNQQQEDDNDNVEDEEIDPNALMNELSQRDPTAFQNEHDKTVHLFIGNIDDFQRVDNSFLVNKYCHAMPLFLGSTNERLSQLPVIFSRFRTIYSRAVITIEAHREVSIDVPVDPEDSAEYDEDEEIEMSVFPLFARINYPSNSFMAGKSAELIKRYNDISGNQFPEDLPIDICLALLGNTAIALESFREELDSHLREPLNLASYSTTSTSASGLPSIARIAPRADIIRQMEAAAERERFPQIDPLVLVNMAFLKDPEFELVFYRLYRHPDEHIRAAIIKGALEAGRSAEWVEPALRKMKKIEQKHDLRQSIDFALQQIAEEQEAR